MNASESTGGAELLIKGANVFDGREPARPLDLVVSGGRISLVAEPGTTGDRDDAIDAAGMTLFPGFIDAHSHVGLLSLLGQGALPAPVQAGQMFAVLASALQQGFTTLRDLGGVDGGMAQAIAEGYVDGPRLLPSGRTLSQVGGHGDLRPWAALDTAENLDLGSGGLARSPVLCTGVDGVRRAAREQLRRGCRQIKVYASGGLLSAGDPVEAPQFTVDELSAAVDEAAVRGTYVTAHAHSAAAIRNGLAAGIRCFEHGTLMDRETARMLRDHDAAVVPTLTFRTLVADNYAEWGVDESFLEKRGAMMERGYESVAMLAEEGVRLGSGADLIGPDQNKRARELTLKSKLVGVEAAVVSATRTNAEILGLHNDLGTLETGKIADIVGYRGNPLKDPIMFDTELPALVVHNGAIKRHVE